MLLIDCQIIESCTRGTNLAETKVDHVERLKNSKGEPINREVYTGRYTAGIPLGDGGQPVEAPINLMPGDSVRVAAAAPQDPREVFEVRRGAQTVWINEDMQATEAERQRVQAAKITKRRQQI